jgi:hypothetical protein
LSFYEELALFWAALDIAKSRIVELKGELALSLVLRVGDIAQQGSLGDVAQTTLQRSHKGSFGCRFYRLIYIGEKVLHHQHVQHEQ